MHFTNWRFAVSNYSLKRAVITVNTHAQHETKVMIMVTPLILHAFVFVARPPHWSPGNICKSPTHRQTHTHKYTLSGVRLYTLNHSVCVWGARHNDPSRYFTHTTPQISSIVHTHIVYVLFEVDANFSELSWLVGLWQQLIWICTHYTWNMRTRMWTKTHTVVLLVFLFVWKHITSLAASLHSMSATQSAHTIAFARKRHRPRHTAPRPECC